MYCELMPWLKACLPGINIILVSLHKTSLRLWQLDPKQEVPGHWLCDAVHPVCFISKSDSWNHLQASHIKRVGLHSSKSSSHWNPCFPSCILHSTFENLILGQYLNPCKTILLNYFWRYVFIPDQYYGMFVFFIMCNTPLKQVSFE